MEIIEKEQKTKKKLLFFKTIAFQLRVANSRNIDEDTCHRQSILKKHPKSSCKTMGDIFRMMKNIIKLLMEILKVFYMLNF